jgi:hypothetical protein
MLYLLPAEKCILGGSVRPSVVLFINSKVVVMFVVSPLEYVYIALRRGEDHFRTGEEN